MAAALEAKLLITAEDRTKAAFDGIMKRMDAILERSKSVDRAAQSASRAMASTDGAIERAGRSMSAGARSVEVAARSMERAAAAMKTGAVAAGRAKEAAGLRASGLAVGKGAEATIEAAGRAMSHGAQSIERAAASLQRAAAELTGRSSVDRGRPAGHGARGRHEAIRTAETLPTERGVRRTVAAGGYMVGGVPGVVAGVVGYEAGKEVFEKSAERQHERVREDIAGMPPSEREDAEKRAALLSARYPQIDQTAAMHTLRNARSITGSYAEASDIADDLLRTRIVAQAARPGRDVEGDFDKLLKGLEQYGVTQDPKAFREAMRRVQKVLAVEGDTLTADSIYQSFKYSRQALPGASQRFMLGTAPALAQEMGGSSFGNALSSFNRAIVTGRMDGKALKTALDLDLIAKGDVEYDKKGAPTHVKPLTKGGHGFRDWKLAASDPDLYIWQRLSKSLTEHGFTDPAVVAQIANTLFSNRMAGDLVGKILTQRSRIEKNQANLASAPDDPAARIMAGDPIAAWKGVENSFSNLAAAIPASGNALTGALNAVAAAINDKAAELQGVKTDHARIEENRQAFNIASSQDLTKVSPTELTKLKDAAAKDVEAQITAKRLELKGVQTESDTQAHMSWTDYLTSGRDKLADATLPFREKNLQTEIAALDAMLARIQHLGERPPAAPPPAGETEHDRIVRAATGGASLAGPFGGGAGGGKLDVSGTLHGDMRSEVKVDVTVNAGSDLIKAAASAKATSKGTASAEVGKSMTEALPTGKSGGARP